MIDINESTKQPVEIKQTIEIKRIEKSVKPGQKMEKEYAKREVDRYKTLKVSDSDIEALIPTWGLNGDQDEVLNYHRNWKPKENKKTDNRIYWKNELQTYDAVIRKYFPEQKYIVDQILPRPALAVLAAKKKLGKSWFVLLLALMVATGKPFLELRTSNTIIVYLALEDGERRINQRLKLMKAPTSASISFLFKFPMLNDPYGRNQFLEMIKEFNPGLIVIDTFAASKNRLIDENDNNAMAEFFNWLHGVTQEYNLSILIVAHHGKKSTGDAGFDIRGGSAISGATDVNMGIYKNKETGTTNLVIEGRDIPAVELTIKLDESDFHWCLQGETQDLRRRAAEDKIFTAIDTLGGKADVEAIATEAGLSRSTAQYHLQRMSNEHSIDCESSTVGKNKTLKMFYKYNFLNNAADAAERANTEAKQTHDVYAADENDGKLILDSNNKNIDESYWESIYKDESNIESKIDISSTPSSASAP